MTTLIDTRKPGGAGCSAKPANLPRSKPVTVNGVAVPRAEIARETQNHPAGKPVDAWLAAARALVVRELLLQEARRLALAAEPLVDDEGRRETEAEAVVRQLVETQVRTPEPDDDSCRRIYERNRARFRSCDLYAVRHILIPAAPGDEAARSRAKATAEAILAAVTRDPAGFARLAAAHSACPSAAHGGSLGQVSRGQTVPEFEAALATLAEPGLVQSRYGFHVVIVDHRVPGRELPFEAVRPQIAAWLSERARHIAIHQYIAMLAGKAEITGVDLGAGASPAGQ